MARTGGRTLVELAQLSAPAPMIMISLAGGAKHGYAIMDDIEALAKIRFGPGTLYGALSRLEGLGLIESLPAEDRRLPYRLTHAGRVALRWHLAGVKRFVDTGLKRLAETADDDVGQPAARG